MLCLVTARSSREEGELEHLLDQDVPLSCSLLRALSKEPLGACLASVPPPPHVTICAQRHHHIPLMPEGVEGVESGSSPL